MSKREFQLLLLFTVIATIAYVCISREPIKGTSIGDYEAPWRYRPITIHNCNGVKSKKY